MAINIFVYIGRIGLGAGHLTIKVGMGDRAFANKIARRARHLTNFFKCPRLPGRIIAAGIDSRIKQ